MVTPSYFQPLLNPPKNTNQIRHKFVFFSISISALFTLLYIVLLIFQSYFSNSTNALSLCEKSHDPPSCLASISKVISVIPHDHRSNGRDVLGKISEGHVSDIDNAIDGSQEDHDGRRLGLGVCLELMDVSRDQVSDSIKALGLSDVLTNYVTCLDLIIQDYPHLLGLVGPKVEALISRARVILSIHSKLLSVSSGGCRKFLEGNLGRRDYPLWLRAEERKLIEAFGREMEDDEAAKDASGDFTTVVEAAPNNGEERHVIYAKEGVGN